MGLSSRCAMSVLSVALLLLLLALANAKTRDVTDLQIGVKYKPEKCDIQAHKGDRVKVHYRGKLTDGTVFDSSFERGDPIEFELGTGQVIKGWDQGLLGMCVGEKRKLKIPAKLGYGAQGSPPTIPGGATLIFDTELVSVNGKPSDATADDTRVSVSEAETQKGSREKNPRRSAKMGISRDSMHKRRATGGKKKAWRKKRKYELGRQPASTKLSSNKTVRRVRVRGGNVKWRALRLDTGNYSWGSEAVTRKTRILDVVYNASNNELVRTQTLVKSAIVQVDAAPFKQWYLQHYGIDIGRKKKTAAKKEAIEEGEAPAEETKKSAHVLRKLEKRQKDRKLDQHIEEQFGSGRLLACISSRPGQCGRADGYILEGKELEFYMKKIQRKKGKGGAGAA
ncbi:hypothetical protein NL676_022134 [Syzygium grande]|nr:hypothetical protein NL676_022134 [Syzygium grande]